MTKSGWDISAWPEEGVIKLWYTDDDGEAQEWEFDPRKAMILAQLLIEKSLTILDAGKDYEFKEEL